MEGEGGGGGGVGGGGGGGEGGEGGGGGRVLNQPVTKAEYVQRVTRRYSHRYKQPKLKVTLYLRIGVLTRLGNCEQAAP